jgi:hypothetical protein
LKATVRDQKGILGNVREPDVLLVLCKAQFKGGNSRLVVDMIRKSEMGGNQPLMYTNRR